MSSCSPAGRAREIRVPGIAHAAARSPARRRCAAAHAGTARSCCRQNMQERGNSASRSTNSSDVDAADPRALGAAGTSDSRRATSARLIHWMVSNGRSSADASARSLRRAHIDDPAGHVGALEIAAQHHERVARRCGSSCRRASPVRVCDASTMRFRKLKRVRLLRPVGSSSVNSRKNSFRMLPRLSRAGCRAACGRSRAPNCNDAMIEPGLSSSASRNCTISRSSAARALCASNSWPAAGDVDQRQPARRDSRAAGPAADWR